MRFCEIVVFSTFAKILRVFDFFMESVKSEVFIINDIDGLRKANSKIYTTSLDRNDLGIIPKTYVSKNKEYLKNRLCNHFAINGPT